MGGLTWTDAARLMRRTGFGTTGKSVDKVVGTDPADYLRTLVAADYAKDPGVLKTAVPDLSVPDHLEPNASHTTKKEFKEGVRAQQYTARNWWLQRMLSADNAFQERVTLAWHGIFATSVVKVRFAQYMVAQNQKQRTMGLGNFRDLAYAMLTDAAMLVWLDGDDSNKGNPNENLAREFMELFTLGVNGGYTEDDVREGARALTGWQVDRDTGKTSLNDERHDATSKTILGKTADFDAAGYCDLVLSQPASPGFVLGRLWQQLVSDAPMDADTSKAAIAAYGSERDVGAALVAMYSAPGFAASRGTKVLGPLEWAIGLGRSLGITPDNAAGTKVIAGAIGNLGQEPFKPPDVGGWPVGQGWLSTSAIDARMRMAENLAAQADLGTLTSGSINDRLDAVAYLLGVPSWSSRSANALKSGASDPKQLVAFAANTPEYLSC